MSSFSHLFNCNSPSPTVELLGALYMMLVSVLNQIFCGSTVMSTATISHNLAINNDSNLGVLRL